MRVIHGLVLGSLFWLPVAVNAQTQMDPRIAPQAFVALQAQLAYLEAVVKAKDDDAKKLAEWWAQYVKGADK